MGASVNLAHEEVGTGDGGTEAWLLHGIFGSRRNWRAFARRLGERLPAWRIVLVDLRGHGDSHPADPPHTLASCAADLVELADRRGVVPRAVIGHSFGGKVALAHDSLVRPGLLRTWVLDASPGPIAGLDIDARGTNHEVAVVLDVIASLETPFASLDAVREALTSRGLSPGLAAWMTTNVQRTDLGFVWRFDLAVIRALLEDYARVDAWSWVLGGQGRVRLLRAAQSDRWSGVDAVRFDDLASRGEAVVLENAGHWVHVDAPEALLTLLAADLSGLLR